VNNTRSNIPNLIIAISGSQRFDIYAGSFTKNDQLTVSPFNNAFLFIPNVTFSDASQILPNLNNAGASQRRAVMEELEARELESYGKGYVDMVYRKWLEEMDAGNDGFERRAAQNLTLGYVTADVCFKFFDGFGQALISTIFLQSCPGIGDDILHSPLPFNKAPDFIGSIPPQVSAETPIDLVFVDFMETQLLEVLNSVQTTKNYTTADVQTYSPISTNQVFGVYAQKAWN